MQIHIIKNENGVEEWIAIEMQGTIEGPTSLEGKLLGNLAWRKDSNEAVLIIGHHLLEGKLCTMEKPMLVTRPSESSDEKALIVDGIITRKIVFKNRPKPIVANNSVKR